MGYDWNATIPEIPCVILSQHGVPQDVLGQSQNLDLTIMHSISGIVRTNGKVFIVFADVSHHTRSSRNQPTHNSSGPLSGTLEPIRISVYYVSVSFI